MYLFSETLDETFVVLPFEKFGIIAVSNRSAADIAERFCDDRTVCNLVLTFTDYNKIQQTVCCLSIDTNNWLS